MYCTVQDIESYFHNRSFKCDDYLSLDKVKNFIAGEAAFIDLKLGFKYDLPFTENNDLLVLKMINEKLVVGTIDDIDRARTDDGRFDRQRNARKEALDILQQIIDGVFILDVAGGNAGVMKFNNIDSQGNEVVKRFSDSNIEPNVEVWDREHHRVIRSN